jgi:PPM family protein phosphatase
LVRAPGCTLLLADGMGGIGGGKEASATALSAALPLIVESEQPLPAMAGAFAAADSAVGTDPNAGGTTLVGAVVTDAQIRVANIGDSRAYFFDGTGLAAVTRDHTAIAEQVHLGIIDAETAKTLPERNLLTRAVSGAGSPADLFDLTAVPGGTLMLCSDGLWGALPEPKILELLSQEQKAGQIAEALCDAALRAGSTDNVTVVVCQIKEPPREKS